MHPIDWVVKQFNPRAARKRVGERLALDLAMRHYEGGKRSRHRNDWVSGGASANATLPTAIGNLRMNAHDLARNNPYARRAIDVLTNHIVGSGIIPKIADDHRRAAWKAWAESTECDAAGRTNIYGLQGQAIRTWAEGGEALIRFRIRPASEGFTIPLQLEVLEGEYIDTTRHGTADGELINVQGIDVDRQGRAVRFHLHRQHPGDAMVFRTGVESVAVPAGEIAHVFRPKRPGQVRGVSELASVVRRLRDLDDYHQALLVKAKIEACLAAFVTTDEEDRTAGEAGTDSAGRRVETFRPGMVEYLRQGESVEFVNPSGAGAHNDLGLQSLQSIAVGSGITYDQLTGDLRQANYSSLRAGKLEFWRHVAAIQTTMAVPTLCDRVWNWFDRMGQIQGLWTQDGGEVEWVPPAREPVDPIKDTDSDIKQIRAGLKTLPQAIAERGHDPARQLEEIAETNATLDDKEIHLDSDPRRGTPPQPVQLVRPDEDD